MKLYILSAAILFFLFLTYFCRQFPKYNRWFAAYLLFTVGLQLLFATGIAAGFMGEIPVWMFAVPGWVLIGLAAVTAFRAQDAVNGIISDGLGAVIMLNLVGALMIVLGDAPGTMRATLSNIAGVVPTGYMLVRFSFVMSDGLPLWVSQMFDSRFHIPEAASAAVSVARSILG